MKKVLCSTLRTFFTVLVLTLLASVPTRAAAQNFSVTPSVLKVSIAKGRTRTLNIEVEYFSAGTLQIGLLLRDRNSAGFVDGDSALEWFTYDDEVALREGTTTLPLEISVPADAGGRYFFDLALFVLENGSDEQDMVRLGYNVPLDLTATGARIVQRVEPRSAELRVRQSEERFLTELTLEAENVGNDLVTFVHNYRVKRVGESKPFLVASGSSQPISYRPRERGTVRSLIPRRLPAGDYEIDVYLQYAGRRTPTSTLAVTIADTTSNERSVEISKTQDIFSEPRMVQFELPRGATRSQIVYVRNYGTTPEVLDVSVIDRNIDGETENVGAINILQPRVQILPGAVLGVPVTASLPRDYPESFLTATLQFAVRSGVVVASSEVYVGDQATDRTARYKVTDFRVAENDGPTPQLVIGLINVGSQVEVPELGIVVRDSRLSTVHRVVLDATDFAQPRDQFTLIYDVLDRIRERPDIYSISLIIKGETLRRFEVSVDESGQLDVKRD
jgi:archaellum component FlaG (FlaF/FlaG flagellin family)